MDTSIQLYDEKIRPIESIEFNIWPNEEILRGSALGKDSLGIEIPDLYENMEPKRGGLIDTRLGGSSTTSECSTCGLSAETCIGHFGHITLAESCFHRGYRDYVKKILSCVCLTCSRVLIQKNEEDIIDMLKNKSARARFAEIRNLVKTVTHCGKSGYGCGAPVTKIKLEVKKTAAQVNIISELQVQTDEEVPGEFKKKIIKQILTPEICRDILKNISDKDCMIMGIDPKKSRPESMVHTIFPVSPVAIRPSAKVEFLESSTKEDDLTHKLADIVKVNLKMKKMKEMSNDVTAKYGPDNAHLLQLHIYTNYDNESAEMPKSELRNKATKSLCSRLKGKDGRIECCSSELYVC